MSEVMAIASGTWQRILRMQVVYFLVLCVLILIGSAYRYDVLSLGMHKNLMVDVSLVLNSIAAILIAVSITFEIPREIREGVASTLLSKPLGRTHYIVGKLVGISVSGIVITLLIALGFCLVFSTAFDKVGMSMIQGHLLVVASVIPMSAVGVLFAVFVPDSLAAILTALVIWLGHSASITTIPVLYGGIIPDFNLFNLKAEASYGYTIQWGYVGLVILWGISFAVFLTSISTLIFNKKDLK
ncbi:MAG: hypothetical protein GXP32_09230 [Kiritimatiellaeota bacterium]|nr:hypothetical protein [Kiritimatiellota bacterium]